MADLIKEFNMIDIIGILIPGSLLILIFGYEFDILIYLSGYFGPEISMFSRAILLLIGGYIVGMMIHEVGDLIEHILNWNIYLNPRTYAAISTKIYKDSTISPNQHTLSDTQITRCLAYIPVLFLLRIFRVNIIIRLLFLILFLIGTHFAHTFFNRYILSSDGNSANGYTAIENICSNDAKIIQAVSDFYWKNPERYTGSLRKRDLFEGFRTMARNLFLVIVLFYLYAVNSMGELHHLLDVIFCKRILTISFYLILCSLVVRYFHYSYIKYKYYYEDYLHSKEAENERPLCQCPCKSSQK